jgi:gliding motility-associated-like protein
VKAIGRISLAVLVFLTCTSANAQSFATNGSASFIGGSCYQITPDAGSLAGSIFSQNPIDLTQPFAEDASFYFGCKDATGADGIVFILATTNTALGGGGGGIGYQGITPSIAIEYDDFFNGQFGDPAADHMAVISMGSIDHTLPSNLAGPIDLPNIEDCMEHCFAVVWDPISQTLTCSLDGELISYTGDIVNTIFGGTTQVYYGFSSGTGGFSNTHRVCFGAPQLTPMTDLSICEGESIDLQADDNGVNWTWAPNPTLSPLNVSDPTATPTVTTDYMVTIEYACGYINLDTVTVAVSPLPLALATNDSPVCEGETLTLMADGGTSYEWDGPSDYSSFVQEPTISNVSIAVEGLYTVTVTDAAGCTNVATTFVVIDTGPDIVVQPVPMPLCENAGLIQLSADPNDGFWEGDITSDGIFDPEYVGVGIHTVLYTATNALGCSNMIEVDIEVSPVPEVSINPPGSLCLDGDPVQLTGTPPGGFWEGEISFNGIFDPATAGLGSHVITYTANDADGCTNSAQIAIDVVTTGAADITPTGKLCGADTITFVAIPPGGIWGGAADVNGQILPNSLPEGNYIVTYQTSGSSSCLDTEISIEIQDPEVIVCPNVTSLCFDSPSVILHADPPGGVWTGAANPSGLVDPSMLAPGFHMAVYTDTANVCSNNSCSTFVEIMDAPVLNNLTMICDSVSPFYIVSFSITGGDTSSYIVTGTPNGTIVPGMPWQFVSPPIPSNVPFNYIVDDKNHCAPDTVAGSHLCNCFSNAGIMDPNLIYLCREDTLFVVPPSGSILDPNDTLVYILHTGNPDSILMTADPNYFVFNTPMELDSTYYISAMVGNAIPGIGVDTLDPCLSVSPGTPVSWRSPPQASVTGPAEICVGDSALITFHFVGDGPFDYLFIDGSSLFADTIVNVDSGFTMFIHPGINPHYLLYELTDSFGCEKYVAAEFIIDVLDTFRMHQAKSICFGDSIFLEGAFQTQSGVYLESLAAISGCDSLVETILTVLSQDTTYVDDTTCDPLQTGVFEVTEMNQTGCDSIIITTVTFAASDTSVIQSLTCDLQDAGIFTTLFVTQEGCDSVVIENVGFIPSDTTVLSGKTCDGDQAGMFIRILTNAAGCDSLIIETIEFIPADTTMLNGETCEPASAGIFTQTLLNADGCDSIIIETISLLPSDTLTNYVVTCFPEDTGTLNLVYTNSYGCDSLVFVVTSLLPYDSCHEMVIPKNLFSPNIFSPNGDGVNDFFFIFSNQGSVANIPYFRIFDRWGGLVLERLNIQPNDPSKGWDGTENGKRASPGVYVWTAMIENTDGKQQFLNGDVTLVR